MAEPGRSELVIAPLVRPRMSKGRGNRTPAFDRPFAPEMRDPAASAGAGDGWVR